MAIEEALEAVPGPSGSRLRSGRSTTSASPTPAGEEKVLPKSRDSSSLSLARRSARM